MGRTVDVRRFDDERDPRTTTAQEPISDPDTPWQPFSSGLKFLHLQEAGSEVAMVHMSDVTSSVCV